MRVLYATPTPEALAALIASEYDLPNPKCTFLNRGFNDIYAVQTPNAPPLIARISTQRRRGPADVASETAFLAHLAAAKVPVAAAIPTKSGALHTTAPLPQGPRPLVLFQTAEGRAPNPDSPEDAHIQGITLAQLHTAAETFPETGRESFRLDLDHLLHSKLESILALDIGTPETRETLTALAARLAAAVASKTLTRTRCHGDCHGLNARITPDRATFFDFDDGAFGFLAYDLAVHLWAQISFGRQRLRMWHAFIQGYRTTRPIQQPDFDAIPLFVPIRHLWLMGEWAGQTSQWGAENFTAAWLDRETAFLKTWEANHLAPTLL